MTYNTHLMGMGVEKCRTCLRPIRAGRCDCDFTCWSHA